MKYLFLTVLMILSSLASADTVSETYVMFCGDKAALLKLVGEQGMEVSDEELTELNESRSPILDILKNGKKGIERVIKLGEEQDTGAFGALIACGVIDQTKTLIKKKGCFDLKANKLVKDNGGIAACAELMARLPR